MKWVMIAVVAVLSVSVSAQSDRRVLAEYKGVPAYSTGQCVEYVRRFLKQVHAYTLPPLGAGDAGSAKYVFERVQNGQIKGLNPHPNGGSRPPQIDDVLCFDHATKAGHVAIVTEVTASTVSIIEQNWSTTGRAVLPLRQEQGQFFVSRGSGSYPVQGWCRVPSQEKPSPVLTQTVLVLDCSASMQRSSESTAIREAFRTFVHLQQSDAPWTVVTFSDKATVHVPTRRSQLPATDLQHKVQSLTFGGMTNLREAVRTALRESRTAARVKIVLVTDGDETVGTVETVLPTVMERKIPVCPVAIGWRTRQRFLQGLADRTGGVYTLVDQLTVSAAVRIACGSQNEGENPRLYEK